MGRSRTARPQESTDLDLAPGLGEAERRAAGLHRLVVLRVSGGPDLLRFCVVRQRATVGIGRDPEGALVLTDASVSREHCRVRHLVPSRLMIEDLGSTNGTRLNGQPVTRPTPLSQGDVLHVGNVPIAVERMTLEEIATLGDAVAGRADRRAAGSGALLPRRYLVERMPTQLRTFQLGQIPVSLVRIEVGRFGEIERAIGRRGAEGVIRVLGRLLREGIRGQDRAVQLGAGEIALVLPDCPEEPAARLAERLCGAVSAHDWRRVLASASGRPPPVNVCAGVAEHLPDEAVEGWLQRAGRALRVARQPGLGRVVTASQAP